jgi:hypothetical protein
LGPQEDYQPHIVSEAMLAHSNRIRHKTRKLVSPPATALRSHKRDTHTAGALDVLNPIHDKFVKQTCPSIQNPYSTVPFFPNLRNRLTELAGVTRNTQ